MKKTKLELDVDFIGGQGPLTKEEEKALSEFFNKRKEQLKAVSKAKSIQKTTCRK